MDRAQDLTRVGKALQRSLGEDQSPIHADLEDPAAGGNELAIDVQGIFQLGRQTDGARLVVSGGAVFDLDLHRFTSTPDFDLPRTAIGTPREVTS